MADRNTVLSLRIIAGLAEKLANDVEAGKLWEGDFQDRYAEISRQMQDLQKAATADTRWGR